MPEFEDYTLIALVSALNGLLNTTVPSDGIIATEAEAIAGTSNTRLMTPLRFTQAISEIQFSFAPLAQAVPLSGVGTGYVLGKLSTDPYDFGWVVAGSGTVQSVSVATANGFAGTSDGDPASPELTISTTAMGFLLGDGTGLPASPAPALAMWCARTAHLSCRPTSARRRPST